jgi:hypothetical protein
MSWTKFLIWKTNLFSVWKCIEKQIMINLNTYNNNKLVAFDPNVAVEVMTNRTIKSDPKCDRKQMKL